MKFLNLPFYVLIIINFILLPITAQERYTTKVFVNKKYDNLERRWSEIDNEWLYDGQKIGITPLFYSCATDSIVTIESQNIIKQVKCKKEIRCSSGYYTTNEENWYWSETDTTWYFMNQPVNGYPKSFTKKTTEIVKRSHCESSEYVEISNNTEEHYAISSALWSWEFKNKIWLFENKRSEKLPTYRVVKSQKTESILTE